MESDVSEVGLLSGKVFFFPEEQPLPLDISKLMFRSFLDFI
jgi:hypothetical protein